MYRLLSILGALGLIAAYVFCPAIAVNADLAHSITVQPVPLTQSTMSTAAKSQLPATDADSSEPRLTAQMGHTDPRICLAFSPDGKYVVTGAWDHTIKLWDAGTGRLIRTMYPNNDEVVAVAFSPDGSTVMGADFWGYAAYFDVATGKLLDWRGFGCLGDGKVMAFAPNGTTMASGGRDNSILVQSSIRTYHGHIMVGNKLHPRALAFSPDGNTLAAGYDNGTVALWNAESGALLKSLTGHAGTVDAVAFSSDGKLLASGAHDGTLKVWDTASGALLTTHPGQSPNVTGVAFSPDGTMVAGQSDNGSIAVWNIASGSLLSILDGQGGKSLAFSPNGSTIASGSKAIALWDVDGWRLRDQLDGGLAVRSLAFNPAGNRLAIGTSDGVEMWDVGNGIFLRTLGEGDGAIHSVGFSPDGEIVAAVSSEIHVWDVNTGRELHALMPTQAGIHGTFTYVGCRTIAFSPDGTMIAGGCGDNSVQIWDAASGKLRCSIPTESVVASLFSVAFSPDSRFVATASGLNDVKLWDVATGNLKLTLDCKQVIRSIDFSSDGKCVATGGYNNCVQVWDTSSGSLLNSFHDTKSDFDANRANATVAYEANGRPIAAVCGYRMVDVIDVDSAAVLQSLTQQPGRGSEAAFTHDGKMLASMTSGSSVEIWNLESGREVCSVWPFANGGWAVSTAEGRFDTNDLEGCSLLHWVMPDNTVLPIELFMRQYFEPRLFQRSLSGDVTLDRPIPNIASIYRGRPTVTIEPHPAPDPTDPRRVVVSVTVRQPNGTPPHGASEASKAIGNLRPKDNCVVDLRLFRDGQQVGYAPNSPTGGLVATDPVTRSRTYRFAVRLPHDGRKQLTFSAYAFNCDLVKSDTDRITYVIPQPMRIPGKVYVVSMGIDDYENPAWNLHYCANDATRFETELVERVHETNQGLAYGDRQYVNAIGVPLISKGSNHTGTKKNLQTVLDILAGHQVSASARAAIPNGEKLAKATPEDMLILSFSCHGATSNVGDFYLFPREIGRQSHRKLDAQLKSSAISSGELSYWLRDVDAGQIAMVIDACYSAASVEGLDFKPGPMDSRGLGQLAYDKGMRILAATQANDVAVESSDIGDGLLTYALIHDGLRAGQADTNPKDGRITLSKWLRYAVNRVPSLYKEVSCNKIDTFGLKSPARRIVLINAVTAHQPAEPIANLAGAQKPVLFDFNRQPYDPLIESNSR